MEKWNSLGLIYDFGPGLFSRLQAFEGQTCWQSGEMGRTIG